MIESRTGSPELTARQANAMLAVVSVALAMYLHNRSGGWLASALAVTGAWIATNWALRKGSPFGRTRHVSRMGILVLLGAEALLFWADTAVAIDRVSLGRTATAIAVLAGVGVTSSAILGYLVPRRVGMMLAATAVVMHLGLSGLMTFGGVDHTVDVAVFQRMGSEALLEGDNPYEVRFPDIYPPELSERFYGPGVSVDGYLTRGYPYPPTSLIPSVLANPFGDIRWAHRLAVTLAAASMLVLGRGSTSSRLASAAFLFSPGTLWMAVGGWTEVFLAAALALVALAYRRNSRLAPLALGFFLSLKQYTVLYVPLIPLLELGPLGRSVRRVLLGVAPWVLLSVPFVFWNFEAFFEAVVTWQFVQPFRPDSMSLLVSFANTWDVLPEWTYAVASLGAAALAALAMFRRAPHTVAGWASSVSVVTLWFVLFSKQAFLNYYFLAIAALLIALSAEETPELEPRGITGPRPPV